MIKSVITAVKYILSKFENPSGMFIDLIISLELIEFLDSLRSHFHRHGRIVLMQDELHQLIRLST